MATQHSINPDAVIAQVKRLILTQLKVVLKACNLQVSGPKATLQNRIINYIQNCVLRGDLEAFNRIRHVIFNPTQDALQSPSPAARAFQPEPRQQQSPYQPQAAPIPQRSTMPTPNDNSASRTLIFKPSPFYSIIQPLCSVTELKAREQTRDNAQVNITLGEEHVNRLLQDSTLRVMLFCAADSMNSPFQRAEIAFPYQVEVRVNQDEVKANLRGLKNKPGSTRPADITGYLRKRPGYENHLQVTYALTTKKYFIVVNLVRQQPVHELVSRLKAQNKRISKERVISEMKSRADDADIVTTSTNLSLKCPLSTLRMEDPCRSTICTHNQCFDATSFLQLQEQAPTWTCPICNQQISFESLLIDMYVDEILRSTPKSLEQVTVEPDGRWLKVEESRSPRPEFNQNDTSDEDDLVEIHDGPVATIKSEKPPEGVLLRTPPVSSREQSTQSAIPVSSTSSNKRPASQVVDLTLSSDDDEETIRGPKRPNIQRSLNPTPLSIRADDIPYRSNGPTSNSDRIRQYPSSSHHTPNYNYTEPL